MECVLCGKKIDYGNSPYPFFKTKNEDPERAVKSKIECCQICNAYLTPFRGVLNRYQVSDPELMEIASEIQDNLNALRFAERIESGLVLEHYIFMENLEERKAYRKTHGFLSSREIFEIRKQYGLSRKEYSRLLGVDDDLIWQYEVSGVQDAEIDELMQRTRKDPDYCRNLLEKHKDRFDPVRYEEIMENVDKENLS